MDLPRVVPHTLGVGVRETPYETCCRSVLDFLADRMPMSTWSISRIDDHMQTHLLVAGDHFTAPGRSLPAQRTLCHRMVDGAPRQSVDATLDPAYADVAGPLGIHGYAASPITDDDNTVGVLCGLHEEAIEPGRVDQGVLDLLAGLLSQAHYLSRHSRQLELDLRVARDDAMLDDLTELMNRRGWQAAIRLADEQGAAIGDAFDVVVVDVDGLKALNDAEGHLAGDHLLRRTAAAIRAVLGHDDTAARVGGDEFALLVRAGFFRGEIEELVARLRMALEAGGVAASIGTATVVPLDGVAAAVEAADVAMYADKLARRSLTTTASPVGTQ